MVAVCPLTMSKTYGERSYPLLVILWHEARLQQQPTELNKEGRAKMLQSLVWSGAFWQPWLPAAWAPSNFSTEIGLMRSVCMNHAIWQWTVDSTPGTMLAWYNTTIPGLAHAPSEVPDPVFVSLEAAAAVPGFGVWLGLNTNSDWWRNYASNETWLEDEFELAAYIAEDLWRLYGPSYSATIAGFYLPLEVDNVNFMSTESQERMQAAYASTVNAIHTSTGKPVMCAPFYNAYLAGGMDAKAYAAWWGSIANASLLDVVALQDGVGANHSSVEQAATWLAAMGAAISGASPATRVWSDLETYTVAPDGAYTAASFSRVVQQLDAEAPSADAVTTFSFSHYDSPQQRPGNPEYGQWLTFVEGRGGCSGSNEP